MQFSFFCRLVMPYYSWLFLALASLPAITHAQEWKMKLPKGHSDEVMTVSVSPDGKYLYSAGRDKTGIVWDVQHQKEVFRHTVQAGLIEASSFDNTGTIISVGTSDGVLELWDFRKGKIINSLKTGWVQSCSFNPANNNQLAFATGKVYTWDYVTNKIDTFGFFYEESYNPIAFSGDGTLLAAGDWDGNTTVWDVNTREEVFEYFSKQNRLTRTLAFRPGTKQLYTVAGDSIRMFDVEAKSFTRSIRHPSAKLGSHLSFRLAFSPGGEQLVVTHAWDNESGSFLVLAADDLGQVMYRNQELASINALAMHPSRNEFFVGTQNGFIGQWDIRTAKRKAIFTGRANRINDVTVLPNGDLTVADNLSVKIIESSTGKITERLTSHNGEAWSAHHLDSGRKLVATYYDSVIIWDRITGIPLQTFSLEAMNRFNRVRHVPQKKQFFLLSRTSGYVKLLDEITLETAYNGLGNVLYDAAVSGDGSLVAYGGDARMNDPFFAVDTATEVYTQPQRYVALKKVPYLKIISTSFSSAAKEVVFASLDRVLVFNLNTGNITDSLQLKEREISKVVFSEDGGQIYIGTFTGKLIAWSRSTNATSVITLPDPVTDIITGVNGKLIVSSEFSIYVLPVGELASWYSISLIDDEPVLLTADKYFMASRAAAKKMHYVGKDLGIITFEQLDTRFNRPDIVLSRTGNKDTALIRSYYGAWLKRMKKLGIDTASFSKVISIPEADFSGRNNISYEQATGLLKLQLTARDPLYTLDKLNAWVNETPLFGVKGITLGNRSLKLIDTVITIPLSQGENTIETSVINSNGIESFRMPLQVNYTPGTPVKEKLHFVGLGIDRFREPGHNLNYSVKDIRDLSRKLMEKYGDDIIVDTLFNEQLTKANIIALKQKLLQSSVHDKVILSYSGHGLLSQDYNYYLSTYNVNFSKPEEKGLPYETMESLLDSVAPRKKLVLVDACHSGEVDKDELEKIEAAGEELDSLGTRPKSTIKITTKSKLGMKNSYELMQNLFINVSRGTGATIISAAGGMQYALERGDLQNGVFTYSIIDAFRKNSTLTIAQLKSIVEEQVVRLTSGLQKPTSRSETNFDWTVW